MRALASCLALALLYVPISPTAVAAELNLTLEGTLAAGQSNASELVGDLAYVVGGGYFNILDVGNPLDIRVISSTDLAGVGAGLVLDGNLAYLMEGTEGISIYDVTDPFSPVRLGRASTSGSARSGFLVGNLLYVAASDAGLKVVNVANPSAPYTAGGWSWPEYAVDDVTVESNIAYAMCVRTEWDLFFPNLMAFSLTNPVAPALVDWYEYPPQAGIGGILVHDSVIFMTDGSARLYSATYSPPDGLAPLGELDCPAQSIALDANGDLFATDTREFASVDVSKPDSMVVISTLPTPRWGSSFSIDAGRTFLPQSDHGALLLDVSDPAQMFELAHYWPPGDANGLTYRDGLLFVAGQQTWVIDVTNPANMKAVAENGTGIWDWVAQPNGFGVGYVAGRGIRALDVATGLTLGDIQPDGQEVDVSSWGSKVYSAQYTDGFAILDFSDPGQPEQIGSFTDHWVQKLAVYRDVLYTAGHPGLIEAFDVSDPSAPVSTFSTSYTDFIGDMVVEGGRLFVCEGDQGVRIFGLDDPLSPQLLSTVPARTRCYDVAVRGLMMAIAEPDHGAFLYDIRDPSSPVLVGSCSRPGRVDEVALSDHTLFLNVDGEGVYAYRINSTVTGTPALSDSGAFLRAGMNPVRSVAEFSFGTAWTDEVELAIYDLAGRQVRSYRQTTTPGQPSLITWDGRDDTDRSVASGVYVLRLTTSRSTVTDKITFIR
jgi:hypothetical protein